MDLNRFTQTEWAAVRERLDAKEGGFDRSSFVAWLTGPDTEDRLIKRFGEAWTLGDALTLATGGVSKRKAGKRQKEAAPEVEEVEEPTNLPLAVAMEDLESRVSARVEEYLEGFEDVSVNDEASLRDLANAEVALGELNKLRLVELSKEFPNADTLKRMTESIKLLSEQTRALQKMLDIDRITRNAKQKKRESVEEIMDVMEQAGKWVEEEAIEIKVGTTLIGYLVTDFPELEHTVMVKMPGGWESVDYKPTEKAKKAVEPNWIADEELRYASQGVRVEDLDA